MAKRSWSLRTKYQNTMITYVTGASGFLGSHLVNKLENPITIPHDQIQTTSLKDFDYFYFLSSYGNLSFQTEDDLIFKANVSDLISILFKVNWAKVKSFVYISSSSVTLPIQTMYSRCKRAAEEILLSFAEKYKAPICIVRPFSITGVGEQKVHLIPRLIESCLEGTPVEFIGSPRHDYIDVEDVIDGLLTLSRAGAKGIYELGTGKSYSNLEVLHIIEKITGKKANIKPGKARAYDSKDWVSRDLSARKYHWAPKIKFRETLDKMVSVDMRKLERRIIDISYKRNLTHISSCLNAVKIIDKIYEAMGPNDKFVLSQGHAFLAQAVVLEKRFGLDAEKLSEEHEAHPSRNVKEGIWVSTGSLGQGLAIAVGMALADKKRNIYVVSSDGEMAEGICWEALRVAGEQKLTNLKVTVIANGYSAYGETDVNLLEKRLNTFHPTEVVRVDTSAYPDFLHDYHGHYVKLDETKYKELIK